jgi:uncharacterized damage-inducible protein DinB
MSTVVHLRRMAANNAWSNLRLCRACAALPREEYFATRTSFFPSIPATLNHILIVDWYYLDALEGGGLGRKVFASEVPHPEIRDLTLAQQAADRRLLAFTRALPCENENQRDEESLNRKVQLERDDHVQVETVVDVLFHLFTHQIHHRGQVHAMLAGTSIRPPQLDEFFLREELPLRREELAALGLPLE